jgi:hypothetical protein
MAGEGAGCSRREALALLAIVSAMATGTPAAFAQGTAPGRPLRSKAAVLSYFNDGLMADPSATLPAFRRPGGYRGAGRISRMNEAQRIAAGIAL